jgi:hypothetical protein
MLLSMCVFVRAYVCASPLSFIGNSSVKIALSLLGNVSVETLPR